MDCTKKTLVVLKPGPNLEKRAAHMEAHFKHEAELMKSGVVLAAGPADDGRGIGIYSSTDTAQVEDIMKKDPFVSSGVLTIELVTGWQHCKAARELAAPPHQPIRDILRRGYPPDLPFG